MSSVKILVQSQDLKTLPSDYAHFGDTDESIESGPLQVSIPVIDFSKLTSTDPQQRIKVIGDLAKACEEWGFFLVVNHSIPETLTNTLLERCNEFFEMPEDDKRRFDKENPLYPVMVRSGSSICNVSNQKVLFWRDYLRFFVQPEFHCPNKPEQLSDLVSEYSGRIRDLTMKLLRAISLSLGLEEDYIEEAMNLKSSAQIFAANYYPPCPQPELATGIPQHTDHGLLTFLLQNGVAGLEIKHNGQWFSATSLPGSIFVNTCDQLEILSNGKYKSVWHRAAVNREKTRMSLVVANGPSLDTVVAPASRLRDDPETPAAYAPMKYGKYVEIQRSSKLHEKPLLERIKLP